MAQRPIAIAGTDVTGTLGSPIILDGSGSSDPEGFSIDTYSWFLLYSPPGSTAIIVDDNTVNPSITPDVVGSFRIFLVVTAGGRSSEPDPNRAPEDAFVHTTVLTLNNGWAIPAQGQRDWDSALYKLLTEVDAAIPFSLPPEVVLEDDNVTRLGSGTELAGLVPIADGAGNVTWGAVSGGSSFAITSFSLVSGSLIEVGDTLLDPSFTASYEGIPITVTLIDDEGGASADVSSSPTAFSYIASYTKNLFGENVSWGLDAVDSGTGTDSTSVVKTWAQKTFWGVGPAGFSTEADIEGLAGSALDTNRSRTFSVTAGPTEKIYYAYRSGYGDATFTVGGFSGGFFKVSGTISVTNSFGFTEDYILYESDNVGLGATTVVVT